MKKRPDIWESAIRRVCEYKKTDKLPAAALEEEVHPGVQDAGDPLFAICEVPCGHSVTSDIPGMDLSSFMDVQVCVRPRPSVAALSLTGGHCGMNSSAPTPSLFNYYSVLGFSLYLLKVLTL